MSKVALVTGGAVRIGRAISLGLAEAGYDVVVNYRSSEAEALAVSRQIRDGGRHCVVARGDVSRSGEVEAVAHRVRDEFGRLDLLVNNASIFPRKPLMDVEEEEWDRVMEVNLKGPFLMVKATADLLTTARGCVVNLVDLSAFQAWREFPHHSVSKAGALHLTRVMARCLAPRIRVNAIAPGPVLLPDDYDEEKSRKAADRTALGRLGAPEDVLRTILFLDRSPFITGEVIVVDGGQALSGR